MAKPVPHDSSRGHVSGGAEYIDDRPITCRELFVDVFYSPVAKGKIKSLDVSKCLSIPEVEAVFTYKDLKHNKWGSIFQDQCLQHAVHLGAPYRSPILLTSGLVHP